MNRKMVLLTWGYSNPRTAKTAAGLLRYCPDECVAVFDPDNAGRKAREFLDTGGETPIIGRLDEAPEARTLVMGIAPPGGRIPDAWRAVLLEAIDRGMISSAACTISSATILSWWLRPTSAVRASPMYAKTTFARSRVDKALIPTACEFTQLVTIAAWARWLSVWN